VIKRHRNQPLFEADVARARDLRARGRRYSEIARSVGCNPKTARVVSWDVPARFFSSEMLREQRIRRASREQAFIDACNRALGLRPADALVMPGCDGPDFNPSL
jgi:hypothetical protein